MLVQALKSFRYTTCHMIMESDRQNPLQMGGTDGGVLNFGMLCLSIEIVKLQILGNLCGMEKTFTAAFWPSLFRLCDSLCM